jgi:hypothetical protein
MSKLQLSVAIGDYDRMRPLVDGLVQIDSVDAQIMLLEPEEIFFRANCRSQATASRHRRAQAPISPCRCSRPALSGTRRFTSAPIGSNHRPTSKAAASASRNIS